MQHRLSFFTAITSAAALSALFIAAHPARAETCAQVEVQNLRAEQGSLMLAAYGDAASFNKAPLAALQMKAGAETLRFPLCGLGSAASVSLMLYQDLNGNGKLDVNALGVPLEPWGASGKPLPMAAPTWAATAVPLDGAPIVVRLSQ
jgi:uncharacterized protein (DUF2141 family)